MGFGRFVVGLGAFADLRFHSRLLHNLGGGADDAAYHQPGGNGRNLLAAGLQFLGVGLQRFEPVHKVRNYKKKNDKKKDKQRKRDAREEEKERKAREKEEKARQKEVEKERKKSNLSPASQSPKAFIFQ